MADSIDPQAEHARRTRRIAGAVMALLAAGAGVISYSDGLFFVRLAGATGHVVYIYPALPDGLITISALSLYDAAARRAARPGWAVAGTAVGALLTLSMNVAAGVAHGIADAVVDGAVPVVFFVSLEILIGLVRRGRDEPPRRPVPGKVPSSVLEAAETSMAATVAAGNPLSVNQLVQRFSLTRAQATEVRQAAMPKPAPELASATTDPAAQNGAAGSDGGR